MGGGYCGLMAAWTLAQHGVDAVVLEAGNPGDGASTRNHGHIGGIGKLPAGLERQVGAERAALIQEDAVAAWDMLRDLVQTEGLDVDYGEHGRFLGAHSPGAYERLVRNAAGQKQSLNVTVHPVPRAEQRREIGSDFYFGGTVTEEAASLQPAKLHRDMRRLLERDGGTICGQARVEAVARVPGGFRVDTVRGTVVAEQVVVATNGYTGPATPGLQRLLVPLTAYITATEEMPADLLEHCLPTWRSGGDTKRSLYAFRRSPDGRRIVFAARARWGDGDERGAAPALHKHMCRVWPELRGTRLSHTWKGQIAFSFSHLPVMGSRDGLHYVAGCNGSGVTRMSYLGRQIALKIAGKQNRPCGYEELPEKTMPFYRGKPWFIPMVGRYYELRDRLDRTLNLPRA